MANSGRRAKDKRRGPKRERKRLVEAHV